MSDRIDEVLREITADADTSPQARERIRDEVMRRIAQDDSPPRGWRRRVRLVPLTAGAVVAAAVVAVALVLTSGGDAGPTLIDRAEAAVTPAGEIVHIVATYRDLEDGQDPSTIVPVVMEDWSVAGPGRALRMRRLITSVDSGAPPDDEDTVIVLDAAGTATTVASWTPGGLLKIGFPDETVAYATSWAALLSEAYRTGALKDAGTTSDGLLRLRGTIFPPEPGLGCETSEVTLDPATFEPRSLVSRTGCTAAEGRTVRISFTVDRLAATTANDALLRIGPWPVRKAVRVAPDGTETPMPVAQAKREAGLG